MNDHFVLKNQSDIVTRGNLFKITITVVSLINARKNFFSEQVVGARNSFPHDTVEFSSVQKFSTLFLVDLEQFSKYYFLYFVTFCVVVLLH